MRSGIGTEPGVSALEAAGAEGSLARAGIGRGAAASAAPFFLAATGAELVEDTGLGPLGWLGVTDTWIGVGGI